MLSIHPTIEALQTYVNGVQCAEAATREVMKEELSLADLSIQCANHEVIVLHEKNMALGFCLFEINPLVGTDKITFMIQSIYLCPEHRSSLNFSTLIEAAKTEATKRKAATLSISVPVRLQVLFKRKGFTPLEMYMENKLNG